MVLDLPVKRCSWMARASRMKRVLLHQAEQVRPETRCQGGAGNKRHLEQTNTAQFCWLVRFRGASATRHHGYNTKTRTRPQEADQSPQVPSQPGDASELARTHKSCMTRLGLRVWVTNWGLRSRGCSWWRGFWRSTPSALSAHASPGLIHPLLTLIASKKRTTRKAALTAAQVKVDRACRSVQSAFCGNGDVWQSSTPKNHIQGLFEGALSSGIASSAPACCGCCTLHYGCCCCCCFCRTQVGSCCGCGGGPCGIQHELGCLREACAGDR
jgi:hypothetical protein